MIVHQKLNLSDKRFERKFILRDMNNSEIISSLFHSKIHFINQYPDRQVNSIYFDNYNYDSIHQNLDGINDNMKSRGIAKLFKKSMKGRITSRILLNQFIQEVA